MEVDLPFSLEINTAAFVIVNMQNDFLRSNAPLGVPDHRQVLVRSLFPRDAVCSFDPQLHEATLKNLSMKFGVAISSSEFVQLASWLVNSGRRRNKSPALPYKPK